MTEKNKNITADKFIIRSVSGPYEILKSDKYLSSGQNITMWLTLYLLILPLILLTNVLLLSLFSTIISEPFLGLGLVSSIFSMIFYVFYIPFFLLNSFLIYKFSNEMKPFDKIFSDNSAMMLLPFLVYSIGAMMTAYEGSLFPLIGLLIMWGAIIAYIFRSINQLKHYQEASGTQPNTQLYIAVIIALMLAPSIIMLLLSPETLSIYYKPVIDIFSGGI